MSEARAVTNFCGNAVATMLVGSWTKTVDMDKVNGVLSVKDPFDELTMVDDGHDRWDKVETTAVWPQLRAIVPGRSGFGFTDLLDLRGQRWPAMSTRP